VARISQKWLFWLDFGYRFWLEVVDTSVASQMLAFFLKRLKAIDLKKGPIRHISQRGKQMLALFEVAETLKCALEKIMRLFLAPIAFSCSKTSTY
jgi:hypothetical protein